MQENKVTDIAPEDLDRLGLLIEQGQFELLLPKVWENADVRREVPSDVRLVYLMNDAVESFWFFKMHGCAELIRRNLTESSQRRWRLRKMAMCWRFIRG
mgnify:CR=1 FL=1